MHRAFLAAIFTFLLGGWGSLAIGSEIPSDDELFFGAPPRLEHYFGDLFGYNAFGRRSREKVKILSGPVQVQMGRGTPGRCWQLTLGKSAFKITIEDGLKLQVTDCFDRLRALPTPYRRALVIVSEGSKDGIAFYRGLDGALAHGGQDYLNILPGGGAVTIAHEAGHILEQRFTQANPDTLAFWQLAIISDQISVSSYGDGAVHEDLAEFAMIHALCLKSGKRSLALLKQLSPMRFLLWEQILYPAP